MKGLISYVVVILVIFEVDGQNDFSRILRLSFIPKTMSPTQLKFAKQRHKLQERVKSDVPFPCPFVEYMQSEDFQKCDKNKSVMKNPPKYDKTKLPLGRSLEVPTSVHRLRPGDIDLVGALGDSLTAGNGAIATNVLQVLGQNRGVSWAIGGQGTWREYLTLPNILKVYNPKLFGYSLGDSLAFEKNSQFNVAEAGAMSEDLIFMTKELVRRIKNDPRVDLQNHWKFINLMIGNNDYCVNFCGGTPLEVILKKHRKELYESLRILKENLPRTIVNRVEAASMRVLLEFTGKPPFCEITHITECPCFFGEGNKHNRKIFLKAIKSWNDIDIEVTNLPEFHDSEDFTIVNQIFTRDLIFLKNSRGFTDFSYMSEDCFHFSQKGYSIAVNALWNNMFEPRGNKTKNWYPLHEKWVCPTVEKPYIMTNKNSLLYYNNEESVNNNLISRKRSLNN